eukprot:4985573-Amphidinium_carterae.1
MSATRRNLEKSGEGKATSSVGLFVLFAISPTSEKDLAHLAIEGFVSTEVITFTNLGFAESLPPTPSCPGEAGGSLDIVFVGNLLRLLQRLRDKRSAALAATLVVTLVKTLCQR